MTNALQQLHDAKNDDFMARLHLKLLAMRGGLRDSCQTVESDAGTSLAPTDAPGIAGQGGDIASSQNAGAGGE